MNFGGMTAWQAWLLIAAAGAAAAYVFRIKIRPPRIAVPSLVLWNRVLSRPREISWWERVRRAVSLVATVVIALALAIAVARPGPRVTTGARGRMLIVLDSSWSMNAEAPSGGTRWSHAVAEAKALAQSAGSDDIALATTADGLVEGPTADIALIETALDQLQPSGGESTAWPKLGGTGSVHFFTDGAVTRPVDPSVVMHSVYERAPNVAITAFDVRPPMSASATAKAYLEMANYSDATQSVRLTVTRDAEVLAERDVDVAAGQTARQVITLAANGGPRLRAHVSASDNALASDDDAVAWLTTADPLDVVIVSSAPDVFGKLLQYDPTVRVRLMQPAEYGAINADVFVFDRWLPETPPAHPMLVFAPPPSPWLQSTPVEELAPKWTESSPHPLLAGVDPNTLELAKITGQRGPRLTPIATSERGTPLVSVDDRADRRMAVFSFTVADSNLAAAPAFPVIMGNALEWLGRPAASEPRRPGPMALPASTSRVTAPDGTAVPLVRAADRTIVNFPAPGLYLVDAGGSRSVVSINVGGPDISNLNRTNLSEQAQRAGTANRLSGQPWWMYGVLLAFVLLTVEWWTWQRRITV